MIVLKQGEIISRILNQRSNIAVLLRLISLELSLAFGFKPIDLHDQGRLFIFLAIVWFCGSHIELRLVILC